MGLTLWEGLEVGLSRKVKLLFRPNNTSFTLEKEMEAHSSILARRIPWTEEPIGIWSIGLQRVGRD